MRKKVLLIGGTGAMGVYLAPELKRCGYEVHITSRKKHVDKKYKYIVGDGHDENFMTKILKTHYTAVIDFMIYSTPDFENRLPLLLKNTDQYFYLSSVTALSGGPLPLTEKTPKLFDSLPKDNVFRNSDEYAIAKAKQENLLHKIGTKKNWTIIRPSITYSKARLQLVNLEVDTLMFRALQGLPIILPRPILKKQATLTWAGDTAKMIAKLVGNPAAFGEDFNLTTAEHHSWREIAGYYEKTIDLKYKTVGLETYIRCIDGRNQMLYHRSYDLIYDNTKILKATGLKQSDFMPLEKGLAKEVAYFKKHPSYFFRPGYLYSTNGKLDKLLHTQIDLSEASEEERAVYNSAYGSFKRFPFTPSKLL